MNSRRRVQHQLRFRYAPVLAEFVVFQLNSLQLSVYNLRIHIQEVRNFGGSEEAKLRIKSHGTVQKIHEGLMTKTEMAALAQRQLEAYNRRDIDAFCPCFHPDVFVHRLTTGEDVIRGMADYREGFKKLFDSNPQLHCELRSRIVLQDSVIDEEWITGANHFPNGLHAVVVYGFRDGLIDRVWMAR